MAACHGSSGGRHGFSLPAGCQCVQCAACGSQSRPGFRADVDLCLKLGYFIGIKMSNCRGIKIKLTSKSKSRLKVVVRDSTDFNGIGWTTSVNVGGGGSNNGRTIVSVDFDKQVPTKFAKIVPGETFEKETVKGLQFVYSKFEYDGGLNPRFKVGTFDVQIEEITAF